MNGGGERRLMVAALIDGLRTLAHDRSARRRLQELRWVTSGDRSRLFAFEPLCEALGLEPDSLRRRLAPLLCEVEMRGGARTRSVGPRRTGRRSLSGSARTRMRRYRDGQYAEGASR